MIFTPPPKHVALKIAWLPFLVALVLMLQVVAPTPALAADNYQLVSAWGSLGAGAGQFDFPVGVAVGPSGDVYVADSNNNRIQKFTSTGVFTAGWGSFGSSDEQFNWPSAISVDASGSVYVADSDNNRIQKFSSTGAFITKWGSYGPGSGQFNFPGGIAVGPSGNVYVTDTNNQRIQVFSATGTPIGAWGSYGAGDGEFNYPIGVAVDASETVYVADTNNDRIQKFTPAGAFTAKWGGPGVADGSFNDPEGIAVDSSGNVFVTDRSNHRIQKFTSTGTFVTKWGGFADPYGISFKYPRGAAVDALGNVYIADTLNDRIQQFNLASAIPPTTLLTTIPGAPDGTGGWFKTRPTITLTRNEPGTTYYQWNSTTPGGWTVYNTALIPPDGINTLYYYSKDSDNNDEGVKSQVFKVDAGLPTAVVYAPAYSTNQTNKNTFTISWEGTDLLLASGVGSFEVDYKIGAGGAWQPWLVGTAAQSSVFAGASGRTYYFRARAIDSAGNKGGWSNTKSTVVPKDQRAFSYRGAWSKGLSRSLYKGASKYSTSQGASTRLKFSSATEITLIVTKRPTGGYGDVYIGRRKIKTINFFSKRAKYRVPIVIKAFSKPTSGTVKLVNTGKKSDQSKGWRIELDGGAVKT